MSSNGRFLGASVSTGYRPQVLGFSPNRLDHRGLFMPGEVDAMRRDPQVQFGLRILYAPLPSVQWRIEGDREVVQLVDQTLKRLWVNHLGQLFAAVVYGHAAAEVLYRQDDSGKVTFDRLRDFHPMDCKPLARDGELAGISVRGIAGENGRGWILPPRSLWLASEAEFGNLYGQSRLRQAWYPWQELTARHGALDVRRHWFVKNAFRGARMRHPSGTIEVEAGVYRTCQDYAREMVEKFETGGVLTLPNTYDPETGKYEWEWEDPTPLGDPPGLNEYIDALDVRILVALGIPPEVARAAETGSGWSGRSIPFIVYLTSEDLIASTLLKGVDEQICRNLVAHQFSAQAARSYQVLPVSLVPPEARDDATQGAAGVPGGQVGQPGQPEQAQGAVGLDALLNESQTSGEALGLPVAEQVERLAPILNGIRTDLDALRRNDRSQLRQARKLALRALLASRQESLAVPQASSDEEESEEDDPGQALAVWYAQVLTALEAAGQDVEDEAEHIEEELGGTGWAVVRGRGAWHAVHEMEGEENTPEQMAAGGERAPKGGIVLNGRHYRGGQFIPGKEIAKASPEDRQRLEQAKAAAAGKQAERTSARKARGSVDHGKLAARLQQHAQAHPLDGLQRRQAASMASLLHRHHGELALHRVEELADRLEQALQSIDEDHPNAEGLRKNLGEQLARLHQAAQAIQGKGVTGEVKGGVTPPTSAATPPTTDTHASIARAFLAHPGAQDNLVSLADLQKATGLSREQLHAAVQDLRQRGLVTLSGSEGRHAAEQSATGEKERSDRDAAIDEDGRKLAYLSVRGDQEDAFGALAQTKQSSEKSDVPALQRSDSGTVMPSGGDENPSGGQAMTKELPKLSGSQKQVAWAEKIRAEKIAQAEGWLENARKALADPVHADYRDHYAKEVAELEAALEYAHTVTSASQWIDWRRDKLRQMAKEAGAIPAAKAPAAQEGTPQDLIQKLIDADDRYQKAAFTAGEEEAFKEREKAMRALQGMSRRELLQHAQDMKADEIRLLRLHDKIAKLPKEESPTAPAAAPTEAAQATPAPEPTPVQSAPSAPVAELPKLAGSDKQVAWAEQIRQEAMQHVPSGPLGDVMRSVAASQTDSQWWITKKRGADAAAGMLAAHIHSIPERTRPVTADIHHGRLTRAYAEELLRLHQAIQSGQPSNRVVADARRHLVGKADAIHLPRDVVMAHLQDAGLSADMAADLTRFIPPRKDS